MEKTLKGVITPPTASTSKTMHGKSIKLSKIQLLLPLDIYTNYCFQKLTYIFKKDFKTFKMFQQHLKLENKINFDSTYKKQINYENIYFFFKNHETF